MKRKFLLILIALSLTLSLFSCGNTDGDDGEVVKLSDIALPNYKSGQTIYLNVYNWGEYISDGSEDSLDVNAEFEDYFNENLSAKYGGVKIKVNYSTYPSNEDMYSKLTNSAVSYDVIIPSDYMIEKMREEKLLISFDASSLSNYGNILDSFKNAYYDPDNSFSVPYTYGMVGVIYNKEHVDPEDIGSWDLLWNEKYAGNILQFNNPRDAFATAMYWKGLDVNSTDADDWNYALELLKEQKDILQGYVNDEIFNKMQTESAWIAPYFVGDFLTMAEEEENLDFYFPEEGVNYFVDAMCIPTCSSNPHLALEYINYMISEEPAVANATYIGYASPNKAVIESEEYIEAMAEYAYEGQNGENAYDLLYSNDPDEVNAKYNALFPNVKSPACYKSFTPEIQTKVNTLWEDLKIAGSVELWIHISTIVIVSSVVVLAVYTLYIKKKRSRHYRLRDKEKLQK